MSPPRKLDATLRPRLSPLGRQHPSGDLHDYGRALLEAYSRTAADALAVLDDRSTGRGHTDR